MLRGLVAAALYFNFWCYVLISIVILDIFNGYLVQVSLHRVFSGGSIVISGFSGGFVKLLNLFEILGFFWGDNNLICCLKGLFVVLLVGFYRIRGGIKYSIAFCGRFLRAVLYFIVWNKSFFVLVFTYFLYFHCTDTGTYTLNRKVPLGGSCIGRSTIVLSYVWAILRVLRVGFPADFTAVVARGLLKTSVQDCDKLIYAF